MPPAVETSTRKAWTKARADILVDSDSGTVSTPTVEKAAVERIIGSGPSTGKRALDVVLNEISSLPKLTSDLRLPRTARKLEVLHSLAATSSPCDTLCIAGCSFQRAKLVEESLPAALQAVRDATCRRARRRRLQRCGCSGILALGALGCIFWAAYNLIVERGGRTVGECAINAFTDDNCTQKKCLVDVDVKEAGKPLNRFTKIGWTMPWMHNDPDNSAAFSFEPFKCCNLIESFDCCSLSIKVSQNTVAFCDRWGSLRQDRYGKDCPLSRWPCLFTIKIVPAGAIGPSMTASVEMVDELVIYERFSAWQFFVVAGVLFVLSCGVLLSGSSRFCKLMRMCQCCGNSANISTGGVEDHACEGSSNETADVAVTSFHARRGSGRVGDFVLDVGVSPSQEVPSNESKISSSPRDLPDVEKELADEKHVHPKTAPPASPKSLKRLLYPIDSRHDPNAVGATALRSWRRRQEKLVRLSQQQQQVEEEKREQRRLSYKSRKTRRSLSMSPSSYRRRKPAKAWQPAAADAEHDDSVPVSKQWRPVRLGSSLF